MLGTARPTITLVPDCGGAVGYGHLERALALSGVLQPLADTVLVTPQDSSIEARVASKTGVGVSLPGDAAERAFAAVSLGGVAMVLDGYEFPVAVQTTLHEALPLAVIDDLALPSDCDLAINPSPGASGMATPGASTTLAGPRFAIVDPVYRAVNRTAGKTSGRERRIYLSTGGSEMGGLLGQIAEALLSSDPRLLVMTASLDPAEAAPSTDPRVSAYRGLKDVSSLMAAATIYVGSAGTTAIQAACAGVPAVLLPVADNQVPQAQALQAAGCAVACDLADLEALGGQVRSLLDDPSKQQRMSRAGKRLIDGQGASRVAQALVALAVGHSTAGWVV